jgi:CubicO group peptidase (beta-lactamase class C family)
MRWIAGAMVGGLLAMSAAGVARGDDPRPSPARAWSTPSDAEIRQILVDRIDTQRQGVGIVVGVIDPQGRRIVSYGALAKGDPRPLGGDTIFEIGSMSKVFTSLLLADMVERGEVSLDDPVAKYLPAGVTVPRRGDRQITLVDLATHTSGLPRLPTNMSPKNLANPYADYSVDQLYAFLGGYALPRDIGAQYEYSNLGGGLLGHVLARRAGEDYETLVRRRIAGPLHMADTTIALSPAQQARLAKGYTAALQPAANWDLPTLAGAGALRSDATDMLDFLAAELGYADTPLNRAMKAQLAVRRPTGAPGLDVALGWHIRTGKGGEVIWHNGGTGGYRTFMGFDPAGRVGVVVLTNTATQVGGDDIGFHLLTGSPLAPPPAPLREHHAITLGPEVLQRYVGRYQMTPQIFLTVTRDGERLFVQATGQGPGEIFPESAREFFAKVVDAQFTFQLGPDGRASGVVLHQNGQAVSAKRVEDAAP